MEADPFAKLAKRAEDIKTLLPFASRPFVIELAGTPKAGKSTSVDTLAHFFKRSRFRVHVLNERASVCPIQMKGHLFFNTWCACTMLAEMVANIETLADIIIKDRGLFDTLIWLRRQIRKGELTSEEPKEIEDFLLMDRWRRLVDLVLILKADSETAIKRELAPRLTDKPGSIMNPVALASINEALDEALSLHGSRFRQILTYNTSDSPSPRDTNLRLANDILSHMEDFLNPEIMVVDRAVVEQLSLFDGGCFQDPKRGDVLDRIKLNQKFVKRAEAEFSNDLVQIVPASVFVHDKRIFLFQRPEDDPKYRLYGKSSIWQGAHVGRREDVDTEELMRTALTERIRERLFLSREFATSYLGCAWDTGTAESARHFGLLFRTEIDSDDVAADLEKKEFRNGRGYGLYGQFFVADQLRRLDGEIDLEPWSTALLTSGFEG